MLGISRFIIFFCKSYKKNQKKIAMENELTLSLSLSKFFRIFMLRFELP